MHAEYQCPLLSAIMVSICIQTSYPDGGCTPGEKKCCIIQAWAKDNTNTGKKVTWLLQFKTAALLQRVIWHPPAKELEVFEVYFK